MATGIVYVMSTVVDGLIKIGKTDDFNKRMNILEKNGYKNVTGLKRQFAIELENYDEKEHLIHTIFSKSRIGNTELFSVDLDLAIQLLASFKGKVTYPKVSQTEVFVEATEVIEEKEKFRHNFKEIQFSSSLTNKSYYTKTNQEGTLSIFEFSTNKEIPNYSKPSKKQIVLYALKDLGVKDLDGKTLYQMMHQLEKYRS